ncbi:conserved exported hypothetical protein [Methylocella tundrae]|uniref:Uncharacterized protein n=1 Tax=Methylocella tundrae TaxID=227605 RepID=A0A8B6M8R7_METTU|nr:conserved exported hypothetical protein [Methylocella tundrae]VTZ50434.1 conserved exported hypothetical protein [Methylocella tundrae]
MNKFRASVLCAFVGFALPAVAGNISSDAASQNDVTGAIRNDARASGGAPSIDSSRPSETFSYTKPSMSYDEAYRNWRNCAAAHQGVGNPPPQCEELREALRQAIGARPRSEARR